MYTLPDFFKEFLETWGKMGSTDQKLYDLWDMVETPGEHAAILKKRDALLTLVAQNCRHEEFPGQAAASTFASLGNGGGEAARQAFTRWRKGTNISPAKLYSLIVFFCMLHLSAQELFTTADYAFFAQGNFPGGRIIDHLRDLVGLTNQAEAEKIKTDETYLVPFLLASLLYCREGSTGKQTKMGSDLIRWLNARLKELNQISGDAALADFQQRYYQALWESCSKVRMQAIVDDNTISAIRENAQIATLYTPPTFFRGLDKLPHPIDEAHKFSRIVMANTGYGKSTFLQATVVCNIFEQLCAFNDSFLSARDRASYRKIKERLGITEIYFPVYVKASMVNELELARLAGCTLMDIAVGNEDGADSEHMGELAGRFAQKDRLLLLVDAFDEIDSDRRKVVLGKLINGFLRGYPSASLIITSRPIALTQLSEQTFYGSLDRITLELFEEEHICALIRNWMRHDISLADQNATFLPSGNEIDQMRRYFMENRYLKELIKNPFILSCALHYKSQNPDATPQRIISHIIDRLIRKRWPEYADHQGYPITPETMRQILSGIAWRIAGSSARIISGQELVSQFTAAARQLLSGAGVGRDLWAAEVMQLNVRAGLLVPEKGNYSFQSPEIEAYLACEYVLSDLSAQYRGGAVSPYALEQRIEAYFPALKHREDIILMLFSPDPRHEGADQITAALFRFLLRRSAETLDIEELRALGRIFRDLILGAFGPNSITAQEGESAAAKQQLARVLLNNAHLFETTDTDPLSDCKDFQDAYTSLIGSGLIAKREEHAEKQYGTQK